MKKLLLFFALCFSFAVNAEMIMPDGLINAVSVEQDEKAYSVILANDSGQKAAINSFSINNKLETATLDKKRSLSYRFIPSNFLTVEKTLNNGLSPLKPDKPLRF